MLIDIDTEFNTYSKQAFSKGKQRILPEAFQELHRLSTEFFYKEAILHVHNIYSSKLFFKCYVLSSISFDCKFQRRAV